ncbi:hypothetical protein C8034_v000454 [Colletotrichum sidae]|uniref:Uncharacterized protein n=1 Tax=Colletotrichum sidae TaxID=1347389 RepID=A0A4R8TG87_9PEZI|nr:hypothetical protein C8034_v000454 [Colletotrichum sidae]
MAEHDAEATAVSRWRQVLLAGPHAWQQRHSGSHSRTAIGGKDSRDGFCPISSLGCPASLNDGAVQGGDDERLSAPSGTGAAKVLVGLVTGSRFTQQPSGSSIVSSLGVSDSVFGYSQEVKRFTPLLDTFASLVPPTRTGLTGSSMSTGGEERRQGFQPTVFPSSLAGRAKASARGSHASRFAGTTTSPPVAAA